MAHVHTGLSSLEYELEMFILRGLKNTVILKGCNQNIY